jgi:hypothetical protein
MPKLVLTFTKHNKKSQRRVAARHRLQKSERKAEFFLTINILSQSPEHFNTRVFLYPKERKNHSNGQQI